MTAAAPALRIATCLRLPEPDTDSELLLQGLRARGIDAAEVAWNDPRADWETPAPTVIRSTWDYVHHAEDFLAWVDRTSAAGPLWNPAHVVRWNAHKRYLVELGNAGLPVVPTVLVPRGSLRELGAVVAALGAQRFVVKPAVGAASFATECFSRAHLPEAQAFLDRWLASRDMMVQPYLESVEGWGERSLVWIDGELTHAIRKSPRFSGGVEDVSAVQVIADDEREIAERFLEHVAAPLLYARIDLARDAQGRPLLMELELIEPSLFLSQAPRALARFADALAARVQGR